MVKQNAAAMMIIWDETKSGILMSKNNAGRNHTWLFYKTKWSGQRNLGFLCFVIIVRILNGGIVTFKK